MRIIVHTYVIAPHTPIPTHIQIRNKANNRGQQEEGVAEQEKRSVEVRNMLKTSMALTHQAFLYCFYDVSDAIQSVVNISIRWPI